MRLSGTLILAAFAVLLYFIIKKESARQISTQSAGDIAGVRVTTQASPTALSAPAQKFLALHPNFYALKDPCFFSGGCR